MKTLMLLRHATAVTPRPQVPDRDRALACNGVSDARELARELTADAFEIDLIISSPAVRALSTTQILMKEMADKTKSLRVLEPLYSVDAQGLATIIQDTDRNIHSLMIVGHQPELENLTCSIMNQTVHLHTCSLAIFAFDAKSWAHLFRSKPVRTILRRPVLRLGRAASDRLS